MSGLAFSGGGIRSAAFCSGVLRRLLQRDVEPDYLSCVSGGGYTGTAYLDWKYRHNKKDDPTWHKQFFEHMRSQAGLLCNWQKPLQGIMDTMILLLLVVVVAIIVPVIAWGSFACPLAFSIDLAFGKFLKAKRFRCNETINADCDFKIETKPYERMLIFVIPLLFFIVFSILSKFLNKHVGFVRFLSALCGSLFAFTFFPWFINDYLKQTPSYVEVCAVVISAVIWFFVPFLRRYSAFVIIVYAFAYVVYWRVYEEDILGVQYTDNKFFSLLFVSGLVMCLTSMVGRFHLHLVHIYNRWRLQKAFYTKESVGPYGCAGIGWHDIFPYWCLPKKPKEQGSPDQVNALTLADLQGIKPQYISNIVVNGWRVDTSEPKYGLLTMTPTEIERIEEGQPKSPQSNNASVSYSNKTPDAAACVIDTDGTDIQPQRNMFSGKMEPKDIKLSQAMAISAAAVSTHMGAYEQKGENYTHILTILGLEMGASMVGDIASKRKEDRLFKVLSYLIRVVFVLPLIILPILYFADAEHSLFVIGMAAFVGLAILLSLPSVVDTGEKETGWINKIARWLIVNVPFCRFMRIMFHIVNTGPVLPAILHLSDGGHIENLALLPLLKRRLQRIVVVNGGHMGSDISYGDDLVHALQLAREKLNCSFLSEDGRDVIEDIREKFVTGPDHQHPRSYRFRVDYYERKENEEGKKVGEGEVILIAPRHPDKGIQHPYHVIRDEEWLDIEWGSGPDLEAAEVDHLTFCCCDCCHDDCLHVCHCRGHPFCGKCCSGLSEYLCGAFPQHKSANQFFTPAMFSAYHREGYHACVEADADIFLGGAQEVEIVG